MPPASGDDRPALIVGVEETPTRTASIAAAAQMPVRALHDRIRTLHNQAAAPHTAAAAAACRWPPGPVLAASHRGPRRPAEVPTVPAGMTPPRISSARAVATWRCNSRSVCTYCRIVNATSECPIRPLSAFQSIYLVAGGEEIRITSGSPH